jgi:hypothetical protein
MLALAGSGEKTRVVWFGAADAPCVDLHCLVVGEQRHLDLERVEVSQEGERKREDACLAQASLRPSTGSSFKLHEEAVGRWQYTSRYGKGVEAEFIECIADQPIYYWSLDPSGVEPLTEEEAEQLGFPFFQLEMGATGKYWDGHIYGGLRQFYEGKGFDPYSQDVAGELGLLLLQITWDPFEGELSTNSALLRWECSYFMCSGRCRQ